jgi:hypothetical protein
VSSADTHQSRGGLFSLERTGTREAEMTQSRKTIYYARRLSKI